jgi:hypothetical protein
MSSTVPSTSEADEPMMSGNVIDGKVVAAKIRSELATQVADLKASFNRVSAYAHGDEESGGRAEGLLSGCDGLHAAHAKPVCCMPA